MWLQIIFILVSLFTLLSAWVVVTGRNLFRSALALMASFLGVAGIYVLLDAGFLAAAQLLVYIGAISILVIFAIMMTRRLMQTTESPFNGQWVGALLTTVIVFGVFMLVLWQWASNPQAAPNVTKPELDPVILQESVTQLGIALVNPDQYVLPFEVASILLLAALIGAIYIARPRRREEE